MASRSVADPPTESELAQRIGIFGGTFDPPHVGHLIAARNAGHDLGLDRVLMMVANEPWQKVDLRRISPAADRLEMTRLAVSGVPGVEVSALEVERHGPTYTIDTLTEVNRLWPGAELVLILGGDAAAGLLSWRSPELIREMCRLAVVVRPPYILDGAPPDWPRDIVQSPLVDLSSSEIRARVNEGRPIDFLVPDSVRRYIEARRLYGGTP